MGKPQEEIWVDPETKIPWYVNHETMTRTARVGGGSFSRALTANQSQVQPQGSGDILANAGPVKVSDPVGKSILSIPGEVRDIAQTPSPLADRFPVAGPQTPVLSKLFTHFFQEDPGVIEATKDFQNNPLRAASDLYQTYTGLKALGQVPGALKTGYGLAKGGLSAVRNAIVENRAGLNKTLPRFALDALEVPPTTPIQTAERLAQQGVNTPLPVVGAPSKTTVGNFASSNTGRTALEEFKQGIGDLVEKLGIAPKKQPLTFIQDTKAQELATKSVSDLLTKGRAALAPEATKALNLAGPENVRAMVWQEMYKNASTGESGILDANKFLEYAKSNGKNIKELIGPEQSVALQDFAHSLVRAQKIGDGAIQPTKSGFQILARQIPATVAGSIGHKLGGPVGGAAAVGAVKAGEMVLKSESFAKLMADKEGRWILARIAGKKATDPSLATDMTKLAALAGKLGVAVHTTAKGVSHSLENGPPEP